VTLDDPVAGQHLTVRYDRLNRVRSRIAHVQKPQGNFCRILATFQYDAAPNGKGRLSRVDDRSGATIFRGYTRRGSPTSVETTIQFRGRRETFVQTSGYDTIGRLATRTLPFGPLTTSETLHVTYSAQGAVEKVRSDHGAFVRNVDHDELGRIVRADYGSFAQDAFDFRDARGRAPGQTTPEVGGAYQPHRFVTTGGDGSPLRDVVYADYSPTGRILAVQDTIPHGFIDPSVNQVAGYDALSRLTLSSQVGGDPATRLGTYAYDNYGRVTSKDGVAYAYGDPARVYQLTSVGGAPVQYDANGSMTELPDGRTLFHDPEGRLAEVRENDFVVAQYLYDHRGVRVAAYEPLEGHRTLYFDDFEVGIESGKVVRHIRLGDRLVASSPMSMGSPMARAEPDVRVAGYAYVTLVALVLGAALAVPRRRGRRMSRRSAALLAGVLLLSDIVVPAVVFAGCPDPRDAVPPDGTVFYHLDHLGGPQLLTNRVGGPLEYRVDRPYGTNGGVYDGSGSSKMGSSGEFGFTGHRLADASGLLYMGARFYDPGLGMFVSHDPAAQFANPYSYGGGDPLNGRDPNGADFGAALALIIVTYLVLPQTVGSIQALVGGASATQAFIAGGRTILNGLAGAGGAGLVGGLIAPGLSQAFAAVSAGLAIAGVAAAGLGGNWQAIAVTAAAFAVGMAVGALAQGANVGGASQQGKVNGGSDLDTRPLTPEEQAYLEDLHGRSFSGVRLDEGFAGERWAVGQVRSDSEINVASGYSGMSRTGRLGLLGHEGTHIVQRKLGILNNFKGFFSHLRASITGADLYDVPSNYNGSFWNLNFEQQAVVVENVGRLTLGQDPATFQSGGNVGVPTTLDLYREYAPWRLVLPGG
jgi:RHS repeat-associated protein